MDPAVYFKRRMIGFFENIASERGIAGRYSDSISIRYFPGYDLTQATPDHSTLSMIRGRLSEDILSAGFCLDSLGVAATGVGPRAEWGIDASVLEANASRKSLVHRDTQEAYGE